MSDFKVQLRGDGRISVIGPSEDVLAPEVQVGRHTYGYELLSVRYWGGPAALRIGSFCSIADRGVALLGGNHRTDWISTFPFSGFPENWPEAEHIHGHPQTNGDIVLGNEVWMGTRVTIMSGVTVGHGAVLAADSTVVKDVPPYAIVGGNPARLLRMRFSARQTAGLLAVRWWDWPDEQIRAEVGLLASDRVDEFLARHALRPTATSESEP